MNRPARGAAQDDARTLINLVNALFTAADTRDWDTYRALMLEEVQVDFAGIGPHKPGTVSADDLARGTRTALTPLHLTQHALTGHTVTIDGDRARVTFYEKALHHHPALGTDPQQNTWTLYGRATRDAVRTEHGWRIAGAGLRVTHQTGNPDLLTAALAAPAGSDSENHRLEDSTAMNVPTDASDVLNVVHTWFSAADARDWDTYRAQNADHVEVHFGGVNDDSEGSVTADDMRDSARSLLDPVHLTQHMLSSEVVRVDGDDATVAFYEEALHYHPALGDDPARNTWVLYGRGEHRLRRTPDGWKIAAATLVPVHETGNTSLLADVAASLQ